MHVEALVLFQPRLHFWVLVSGVVVDDQMQLKMLGRFSIDLLEKVQPLLMSVLVLNAADQAALEIVQRGEQRDGAVAYVIVRLRANMTDPEGQARLGTFEGLYLTLFIAAEHQSLLWRVEIESDDIPEFFLEIRIFWTV